MEIKKGAFLKIRHDRKGEFTAEAQKDFNTGDEFYPIIVLSPKVAGFSTPDTWIKSEEIPCRGSLCTIEVLKTNGHYLN